MKIKTKELRKIILIVMNKIESYNEEVIHVKNDFYWNIPEDKIYNIYEKPQELTIGQISEDIKELKRLLKSEEDIISYDLKRLGELLITLSVEN